MFRNVFSGCVSDRSSQAELFQSQKLKFGATLSSALKHGFLPGPLVDILVYIAKEGVVTADVFRRPGNPNDTRRIVKRLTEGKQVIYSNYSFYTLASVVKKFLLKLPGGVLTPEGEEQLLQVLTLQQKMEQIEVVHHFIESLAPAHQRLVALLFGTWFRIVAYSDVNCMSVEALSRSVAGSMFHTCAEDPAKVEKASRIMQFLIENYGVENMFGSENIQYFVETTRTGLHIRELYRYSCCPEADIIPCKVRERLFEAYLIKEAVKHGFDIVLNAVRSSDFIEVTRVEHTDQEEDDEEEHRDFLGRERQFSQSPELSPSIQHSDYSHDPSDPHDSELMINMSTLSAPEVSLMPSPEVSKRPKSLEDNLNEVRSHYQSRCLSRFNSVKRKQLERLRQRSDWFLSPTTRESRNNSRKGREGLSFFTGSNNRNNNNGGGHGNGPNNNYEEKNNNKNHNGSNPHNHSLHQTSGNSTVVKASSEGAVLEAFSDGDSVFTDNTSRSESPASEPVWSHILKVHSRDIIHSDTIGHLTLPEISLDRGSSGFDLSLCSQDDLDIAADPIHQTITGYHRDSGDDSKKGEEEDENVTPTGTQEEDEDITLLTSSLPDIHQPSASEDSGSSSKGEEMDKDSPSTLCGGSGEEEVSSESGTISNLPPSSAASSKDIGEGQSLGIPETEEEVTSASEQTCEKADGEGDDDGDSQLVRCFLKEKKYDHVHSPDS